MRRVHFYDNTIYDTLGHNFLFEDGMEERNTIEHNLGVLAKGVRWGCKRRMWRCNASICTCCLPRQRGGAPSPAAHVFPTEPHAR